MSDETTNQDVVIVRREYYDQTFAKLAALQAEVDRLRNELQEILDLARTSLAPDALNIGQQGWSEYRVNKIARMASEALEGGE